MTSTQPATTTSVQPPLCHANNCDTPVEPAEFMCPLHWSQVPSSLRESITATYRPVQEPGIHPSKEYLAYAAAAIAEVAHKENRQRKRTRHIPSKPDTASSKPVQLALFESGTPS
jgi:hypothetical protein